MGNILIIKNADFSEVSVSKVTLLPDNYVKISVKSSIVGAGTLTGSGFYAVGTQIQISATPNYGYEFIKWSDGNINSQRTIIVGDTDQTYTAMFKIIGLFNMANGALITAQPINQIQPDDDPYKKYTSEEIYYSQNGAVISHNASVGATFAVCTIVHADSLNTGTWDVIAPIQGTFIVQPGKYIRAYINIGAKQQTDEQAQMIMNPVNFQLQSGAIELVEE